MISWRRSGLGPSSGAGTDLVRCGETGRTTTSSSTNSSPDTGSPHEDWHLPGTSAAGAVASRGDRGHRPRPGECDLTRAGRSGRAVLPQARGERGSGAGTAPDPDFDP